MNSLVFLGRSDDLRGRTRPRLRQFAMQMSALKELQSSPQTFTPQFKMEWDRPSTPPGRSPGSVPGARR
jgi:hypothetical protein